MRNPICAHKICEMTTCANPSMLSKPLYPGHFHLIDWHDRLLYLAWTDDFSTQICPSGMMIDRLGNLNNRTKTSKNLMNYWLYFGILIYLHQLWLLEVLASSLLYDSSGAEHGNDDPCRAARLPFGTVRWKKQGLLQQQRASSEILSRLNSGMSNEEQVRRLWHVMATRMYVNAKVTTTVDSRCLKYVESQAAREL